MRLARLRPEDYSYWDMDFGGIDWRRPTANFNRSFSLWPFDYVTSDELSMPMDVSEQIIGA